MARHLRAIGILLILIPFFSPLYADRILVIGDSWAEPIGVELRAVLAEKGVTDVPVETTPYWGGPRNLDSPEGRAAISGWLDQWPDAKFLYMMMGQNNWLCCRTTAMIGSQEEADLFASIVTHTENVVDYILSIRPDMRIVWTTGEYFRPHRLGTPTQINANHDRLAGLAGDFAKGRPELTFIHWNGLLQVAFGFNGVPYSEYDPDHAIPAGDPSLPDATLPSPYLAFRNAAHPNQQGYRVLATALYDRYFAHELGGPEFRINAGLSDAWFNPATAGQGFLITVFPVSKQIFLAWFTYDAERPPADVNAILGDPGHRWVTAQGPYQGDTANLTLFVTTGGVFDQPQPRPSTDGAGNGSITIEWADCTQGILTYMINSLEISGEIPIERIARDNVELCLSLHDLGPE